MVKYTSAPGDVESGLEERSLILVEKKSSTEWMCKVLGGLFIAALCLGGVLAFSGYWNISEMMTQSGQTAALSQKHSAEKTEPHNTLRQIGSRAKAAIHLEGRDEEDNQENKLVWKNDVGLAFTQGGFELVDNQIVIPQSGLYFVYSQASFRVSCSDDDDDDGKEATEKPLKSISYRVRLDTESLGTQVSLMSAVRSACQKTQEDAYRNGQGWYNAIYLGAVFQLNEGDKLWTDTNMPSELETESGKTFFGVFAL